MGTARGLAAEERTGGKSGGLVQERRVVRDPGRTECGERGSRGARGGSMRMGGERKPARGEERGRSWNKRGGAEGL